MSSLQLRVPLTGQTKLLHGQYFPMNTYRWFHKFYFEKKIHWENYSSSKDEHVIFDQVSFHNDNNKQGIYILTTAGVFK
jgi:hypothetical protein